VSLQKSKHLVAQTKNAGAVVAPGEHLALTWVGLSFRVLHALKEGVGLFDLLRCHDLAFINRTIFRHVLHVTLSSSLQVQASFLPQSASENRLGKWTVGIFIV